MNPSDRIAELESVLIAVDQLFDKTGELAVPDGASWGKVSRYVKDALSGVPTGQAPLMVGASTHEQVFDALDAAHELSGPPHERIKKLIEQRDEARLASRQASTRTHLPFGWACWIGEDAEPKRAQFSATEPLAYSNRKQLYVAVEGSYTGVDWPAEFAKLQTSQGVHLAMLHGKIAKIDLRACAHTHGEQGLANLEALQRAPQWHIVPTTLDPAMHKAMDWAFNDAMHVGIPVSPEVWAAALASAPTQHAVPASALSSNSWDDQLSDAASARAAIYDGDNRQDIKTDVFNAFCKGAMWARVNPTPIDMVLFCPSCGRQHIDEPAVVGKLFMCHHSDPMTCSCSNSRWQNPPHRSHLCHNPECKTVWRPADVPTNGVAAIKTNGRDDTCKVDGGA